MRVRHDWSTAPPAARATTRPAGSSLRLTCPARSRRCASSESVVSLLPVLPAYAHTTVASLSFFFLSTERIDASYFKAPLATSKSRQTTSEDAWALFISRYRYADNEYYSNQFNMQQIRSERDIGMAMGCSAL